MKYFTVQDISTVQQYLSNQLAGAEKEAFEQRLAQDIQLQEELEWYKAMFNALEETEDQRLKALLKASNQEKEVTPKVKRLNTGRWAIAAVFLLIVAILSLLWFLRPEQRPEQELFAVKPISEGEISLGMINVRTLRTDDKDKAAQAIRDSSIQEEALIINLYNGKKYQEALHLLDKMPATAAILFYRANCLMALNQNQEAILILKKVETYTNETFSNFAQWYLALAYEKVGNKKSAKEYALKTINNTGVPKDYRDNAHKLIGKLGN